MCSQVDVLDLFVCPSCRAELSLAGDAGEIRSLAGDAGEIRCAECGCSFDSGHGIVDFVSERAPGSERAYYDQHYGVDRAGPAPRPSDVPALARGWTGPNAPWEMQRVWGRIGDIAGKTVLLVGNGESVAELYMLTADPGVLIYSDLSPVGLAGLAAQFADVNNVFFAAIDALDLPLREGTVDLVYGFAFVHHLPHIDRFLAEVVRVLRPGGRAVFMDNGYSPLWQHLKLVWLRPLMWLSHRREPRSPEDVRDTIRGGLREDNLSGWIRAVGGEPWFERVAFLYFYWKRVSVSLFPEVFRIIPRHDLISLWLKSIDCRLARFRFIRRNMIRLIWGLDKPTA